ncbi:50S ribosomal protein L15, chloroplastic [Linum perenne]
MATLLSITPSRTALSLPGISSSFKVNKFPSLPSLQISQSSSFSLGGVTVFQVNSSSFRANPTAFRPLIKTHSKSRTLLVVNRASSKAEAATPVEGERLRLNNLAPQPGSRKRQKRKGRGIAAGQGNSCGFGMRGQKSRSGPGIMRGFEGGQMPLYRRLPKLKGIAGGKGKLLLIDSCMKAGLPKYVPVNLKDIAEAGFEEGDEVSLESLIERGLINPSGRERKLPLKILGDGEINVKLNFKARAFSTSAKEKLEAVGCSITVLPGRKKWLNAAVTKNLARAEEYFAKKRAAAAGAEPAST